MLLRTLVLLSVLVAPAAAQIPAPSWTTVDGPIGAWTADAIGGTLFVADARAPRVQEVGKAPIPLPAIARRLTVVSGRWLVALTTDGALAVTDEARKTATTRPFTRGPILDVVGSDTADHPLLYVLHGRKGDAAVADITVLDLESDERVGTYRVPAATTRQIGRASRLLVTRGGALVALVATQTKRAVVARLDLQRPDLTCSVPLHLGQLGLDALPIGILQLGGALFVEHVQPVTALRRRDAGASGRLHPTRALLVTMPAAGILQFTPPRGSTIATARYANQFGKGVTLATRFSPDGRQLRLIGVGGRKIATFQLGDALDKAPPWLFYRVEQATVPFGTERELTVERVSAPGVRVTELLARPTRAIRRGQPSWIRCVGEKILVKPNVHVYRSLTATLLARVDGVSELLTVGQVQIRIGKATGTPPPERPVALRLPPGPIVLPTGRPWTLALTRPGAAKLELASGPRGLTLTGDTLRWTPGESQRGRHTVQLRVVRASGHHTTRQLALLVGLRGLTLGLARAHAILVAGTGAAVVFGTDASGGWHVLTTDASASRVVGRRPLAAVPRCAWIEGGELLFGLAGTAGVQRLSVADPATALPPVPGTPALGNPDGVVALPGNLLAVRVGQTLSILGDGALVTHHPLHGMRVPAATRRLDDLGQRGPGGRHVAGQFVSDDGHVLGHLPPTFPRHGRAAAAVYLPYGHATAGRLRHAPFRAQLERDGVGRLSLRLQPLAPGAGKTLELGADPITAGLEQVTYASTASRVLIARGSQLYSEPLPAAAWPGHWRLETLCGWVARSDRTTTIDAPRHTGDVGIALVKPPAGVSLRGDTLRIDGEALWRALAINRRMLQALASQRAALGRTLRAAAGAELPDGHLPIAVPLTFRVGNARISAPLFFCVAPDDLAKAAPEPVAEAPADPEPSSSVVFWLGGVLLVFVGLVVYSGKLSASAMAAALEEEGAEARSRLLEGRKHRHQTPPPRPAVGAPSAPAGAGGSGRKRKVEMTECHGCGAEVEVGATSCPACQQTFQIARAIGAGTRPEVLVKRLVDEGWDEAEAARHVGDKARAVARRQARADARDLRAARADAIKNLIHGACWLGGGLAITILTYLYGDGRYVFAYGAILTGAAQCLAGAIQLGVQNARR